MGNYKEILEGLIGEVFAEMCLRGLWDQDEFSNRVEKVGHSSGWNRIQSWP